MCPKSPQEVVILPGGREALLADKWPQTSPGHIWCLHWETQQGTRCGAVSVDVVVSLDLARPTALGPRDKQHKKMQLNMDAVSYLFFEP